MPNVGRPHDAVYRAKCSCGEILRVDLAAVVEHTDGGAR